MKTYYTIYKITNTINNKIYIGMHQTKNLNDGYYGSGKLIKRAIAKHGIENFTKEYLAIFDDKAKMIDLEKEIINEIFVERADTYNIKLGGKGGWDHITKDHPIHSKSHMKMMSDSGKKGRKKFHEENPNFLEENGKKYYESGLGKFIKEGKHGFRGKHHTDEAKRKIGIASSKNQAGEGNSQYGKHQTEKQKHQTRQALKNKPIITCPHCGFKNNNKGAMNRWHNDNCKYR